MRIEGLQPLLTVLATVMAAAATLDMAPSVPALPPALAALNGVSGFVNVWRHHLRLAKKAGEVQQAEPLHSAVIVAPQTHLFANMAPQGSSRHPLYMASLASNTLRTDILLAALSAKPLNREDLRALQTPDGEARVMNLKGDDLLLKTDARGSLTVNGVPGKLVAGLPDSPTVVVVADFLFDHRQRVAEVRQAARELR